MKTGIWALVFASLVIVGCENGSNQSMESANKNIDSANALSREAATEYLVATTKKNELLKQSPMAAWTPEQRSKLKAMYVSSRAKFLDARSRFSKALDRTPNAANTKVAKDSMINEIYRIDQIVANIDGNLQNLEVATPVVTPATVTPVPAASAVPAPVEAAAAAAPAAAETAASSASAAAAE